MRSTWRRLHTLEIPDVPEPPEIPENREASRGEPSSHGTRLTACLNHRGWRVASPPAVIWTPFQGSALSRGVCAFKDNNDHEDIKDA